VSTSPIGKKPRILPSLSGESSFQIGDWWGLVPALRKLFSLQEMISIQHVRIGVTFSFDARFLGLRNFPILVSALLL
jgi:hypothetical protein